MDGDNIRKSALPGIQAMAGHQAIPHQGESRNPEIAAPDSPDREQHISSHNDPEPDIDDRSSFGKRRKG
jgi:hypothetical protein